MTKLRIIFLIVCVLFLPVKAGEVGKPSLGLQINWALPLSRGLVCYLPFNEHSGDRVADLSGNRNIGTFVADTSWSLSKFGLALEFDGTNDYVDVGSNIPDFTAITWVAWVYPKDEVLNCIIGKWVDDTGWLFSVGGSGSEGKLSIETPNDTLYASTSSIPLNTWTHVAATMDGSNVRFYINGILDRTQTQTSAINNDGLDTYIGRLPVFGGWFFNGKIDVPAIYNRALSASKIAQLYQKPFCMFQRPNIAMWAATTNWLNINSSHYDSHCGDTGDNNLTDALNGDEDWAHQPSETHWFILDLGQRYAITKVQGRSNGVADPIDVDIYVSNNKSTWGAAVGSGISVWQDTDEWQEFDITDKTGRYIKVEIPETENGVGGRIAWGGDPSFSIFDVYGTAAPAVAAGQFISIMMD